MPALYTRFSGGSIGRLAGLSDGVFAIAMTLLVLELHVPVMETVHHQGPVWEGGALGAEQELWHALALLAPKLLAYVMSFLTLGIFWVGQQTQLNQFERADRHLTWIHLAFLAAVSLMPFSTALLGEYIEYRLALAVYWLDLLLLGAMLLASITYGHRAGLLKADVDRDTRLAHRRRIIGYQGLYAVAVALSVINTYVSIVLIVLLQLNSAVAPRAWRLSSF
ncbi:TMEM175 family protein [Nonomuraea roseoviolacea]|uniref:Membrane protein n=1 Tax=Nonomuraea roseoviolacea subsp. carminata TaxID=160689 RepID=A0ABT1K7M0_9ACTN|nr:TMEM175 family protein [Nonomuraea roseoviolacea]MCP2349995.1 putative membrane protein [Nonomuraea roseoviolacea subsp. carminata]